VLSLGISITVSSALS